MKIKPQTEKEITARIRLVLKNHGIFHWKVWQGLGSQKGVSDIVGIFKGRFFALEVKTVKGRLSDYQRLFLSEVAMNGGIAFVARSVDDVIDKFGLR